MSGLPSGGTSHGCFERENTSGVISDMSDALVSSHPNELNSSVRNLDLMKNEVGGGSIRPKAIIKLENFSTRTTDRIFYFSILFLSLSVANIVYLLANANRLDSRGAAVAAGTTITLSAGMSLFLILAFPQRIYFHARKHPHLVVPEQVILAWACILVACMPGTATWFCIKFWLKFAAVNKTGSFNGVDFLAQWSLGEQRGLGQAAAVFMVLWTSTVILLFGILRSSLREQEDGFLRGTGVAALKGTESFDDTKDKEDEDEAEDEKMKEHLRLGGLGYVVHYTKMVVEKLRDSYCAWGIRENDFRADNARNLNGLSGLDAANFLLALVQTILILVLSNLYDFVPDAVGISGLISVLRVCTQSNSTVESLNNLSLCSRHASPLVFQRAISGGVISGLFLLHCVLFYLQLRATQKTLSRVPYTQTRYKQITLLLYVVDLGAFMFIKAVLAFVVMLVADIRNWIFRSEPGNIQIYDPLYQVGLSPVDIIFYHIVILDVVATVVMATGFLPAESKGFKGWFRHCDLVKYDEAFQAKMKFPPLYVHEGENGARTWERRETDDMRSLGSMSSKLTVAVRRARNFINKANNKINPTHIYRSQMAKSLGSHYFASEKKVARYITKYRRVFGSRMRSGELPFITQTRDVNAVVMETTILAFNFSYQSYMLSLPEDSDSEGAGSNSKSSTVPLEETGSSTVPLEETGSSTVPLEETGSSTVPLEETGSSTVPVMEAANSTVLPPPTADPGPAELILDDQYKFEEHIWDKYTDTHILVAYSDDRVIFSFRGTASDINARTDLKMKLVDFDPANDPVMINWIAGSGKNEEERYYQQHSMKAQVHQGFFECWRKVRDDVYAVFDRLVMPRPEQQESNEARQGKGSGAQRIQPRRAVLLTGHSLGGALASLFAFDLAVEMRKRSGKSRVPICCYSFGSPRTGNFVWMTRHRHVAPNTMRFVNASDVIPKTPTESWGKTYFLRGYFHVGVEILLSLSGRLIIEPSYIERHTKHGFFQTSLLAHSSSRYCFSLIMWCIRAHYGDEWQPQFWAPVMDGVDKISHSTRMCPVMYSRFTEITRIDGFRYSIGKVEVLDRAAQTVEPDGFLPEPIAEAIRDLFLSTCQSDQQNQPLESFWETMKNIIPPAQYQLLTESPPTQEDDAASDATHLDSDLDNDDDADDETQEGPGVRCEDINALI